MSDEKEYTQFANRSGQGNFCSIKPGKDKFIRVMFIQIAADGAGALTMRTRDNAGNWHAVLGFYLVGAGTIPISLPDLGHVSKGVRGGILLKDLYDNGKPYRVALNKEALWFTVGSGTANWVVTVSWREEGGE